MTKTNCFACAVELVSAIAPAKPGWETCLTIAADDIARDKLRETLCELHRDLVASAKTAAFGLVSKVCEAPLATPPPGMLARSLLDLQQGMTPGEKIFGVCPHCKCHMIAEKTPDGNVTTHHEIPLCAPYQEFIEQRTTLVNMKTGDITEAPKGSPS